MTRILRWASNGLAAAIVLALVLGLYVQAGAKAKNHGHVHAASLQDCQTAVAAAKDMRDAAVQMWQPWEDYFHGRLDDKGEAHAVSHVFHDRFVDARARFNAAAANC